MIPTEGFQWCQGRVCNSTSGLSVSAERCRQNELLSAWLYRICQCNLGHLKKVGLLVTKMWAVPWKPLDDKIQIWKLEHPIWIGTILSTGRDVSFIPK